MLELVLGVCYNPCKEVEVGKEACSVCFIAAGGGFEGGGVAVGAVECLFTT